MASRAARVAMEKEQARKKMEDEQQEKLALFNAAKARKAEEESIAKEKQGRRVLARAKDILRYLISRVQKEDSLQFVLEWKRRYVRDKTEAELKQETDARNDEDAKLRELEAEMKAEYEAELEKERARQRERAIESGQPLEEEKVGNIKNDRAPDARDSGNRMWAVDNLLDPKVRSGIRNMHIQKVGILCVNLQQMQFDKEQINAVVRALYLTQTEEDMLPAFNVFDVAGLGEVRLDDFRTSLNIMGEDVPGDKIDKLFQEADLDGSGGIDFQEFCVMMRKFNPMPQTILKKTFNSKQGTVAAVLDEDIQRRLHPLQKKKAGAIVQNMMKAKYFVSQINAVVRALYMGQAASDPIWEKAWEVFDFDGSGALDAKEFRRALKLMGEKVSEKRLDELFEMADEDGSGEIEFEEFVMLLRQMNPKPTLGGLTKSSKGIKPGGDKPQEIPLAKGMAEYLDMIDLNDYAEEFATAKQHDPNKIEAMSLVHLGNVLLVSNAERNMIYNKVQGYASRRNLAKKVKLMTGAVTAAKGKAGLAKFRAKDRKDTSEANLQANYHILQQVASQSIVERHPGEGPASYRPGAGIAAEFAALRGDTSNAPLRTACPLKCPPTLRSPLRDSEWNSLTSPPRSPEARTPGYEVGLGLPASTRVNTPGQPRTPYRKRRSRSALDNSPLWYTTPETWHRYEGAGPLIGTRVGQPGLYRPPPGNRMSSTFTRLSPIEREARPLVSPMGSPSRGSSRVSGSSRPSTQGLGPALSRPISPSHLFDPSYSPRVGTPMSSNSGRRSPDSGRNSPMDPSMRDPFQGGSGRVSPC